MTESPHRRTGLIRAATPPLILAAAVAGFAALGSKPAPATRPEPTDSAVPVAVVIVRPAPDWLTIEVDGLVQPAREVRLAAEVAGRIVAKAENCRAGRFVRRDTVLMTIDPRDYELEVRRLQREFQQAQALVAEVGVEIANVQSSLELVDQEVTLAIGERDRAEQLTARGGATPAARQTAMQRELQVRRDQQSLRNELALLKARRERLAHAVELAEAQLQKARLDLERTAITAPVDGMIVADAVEAGQYVQRGTPVVTIEDAASAEVRCQLRMEELHWLWRQPATAPPAAEHEIVPAEAVVSYRLGGTVYTWHGRLSRYDGWGLDERTRTVPCRVAIEEPLRRGTRGEADTGTLENASCAPSGGPPVLMRGMYVTVGIRVRSTTHLVLLPEHALRAGDRVWLVDESERLRIRSVEVARTTGAGVLIEAAAAGMKPGDRVIVSPLSCPVDGLKVESRETPHLNPRPQQQGGLPLLATRTEATR